eukprot:m.330194 g.330194  ORF g.330194 m.330194 type:complete len:1676 (-) comp16044_c0_seq7:1118-6145(-)
MPPCVQQLCAVLLLVTFVGIQLGQAIQCKDQTRLVNGKVVTCYGNQSQLPCADAYECSKCQRDNNSAQWHAMKTFVPELCDPCRCNSDAVICPFIGEVDPTMLFDSFVARRMTLVLVDGVLPARMLVGFRRLLEVHLEGTITNMHRLSLKTCVPTTQISMTGKAYSEELYAAFAEIPLMRLTLTLNNGFTDSMAPLNLDRILLPQLEQNVSMIALALTTRPGMTVIMSNYDAKVDKVALQNLPLIPPSLVRLNSRIYHISLTHMKVPSKHLAPNLFPNGRRFRHFLFLDCEIDTVHLTTFSKMPDWGSIAVNKFGVLSSQGRSKCYSVQYNWLPIAQEVYTQSIACECHVPGEDVPWVTGIAFCPPKYDVCQDSKTIILPTQVCDGQEDFVKGHDEAICSFEVPALSNCSHKVLGFSTRISVNITNGVVRLKVDPGDRFNMYVQHGRAIISSFLTVDDAVTGFTFEGHIAWHDGLGFNSSLATVRGFVSLVATETHIILWSDDERDAQDSTCQIDSYIDGWSEASLQAIYSTAHQSDYAARCSSQTPASPTPANKPTSDPVGSSSHTTAIAAGVTVAVVLIITLIAIVMLRRGKAFDTAFEHQLFLRNQDKSAGEFARNYGRVVSSTDVFEHEFAGKELQRSAIALQAKLSAGVFGPIHSATLRQSTSIQTQASSGSGGHSSESGGGASQSTAQNSLRTPCTALVLATHEQDLQVQYMVHARLLLALSRHPNILNLVGFSTQVWPPIVLTEYMVGGTLQSYLLRTCAKQQSLGVKDLVAVLQLISSALAFIETHNIIHRDLALDNVYVGATLNDIRLAGFASARDVYRSSVYVSSRARQISSSSSHSQSSGKQRRKTRAKSAGASDGSAQDFVQIEVNPLFDSAKSSGDVYGKRGVTGLRGGDGSSGSVSGGMGSVGDDVDGDAELLGELDHLRYTAPEIIDFNEYSTKTDVYAFGVVMWETLSYGKPLYGRMPPNEIVAFVQDGKRVWRPSLSTDDTYAVITACMDAMPESRPSFTFLHSKFTRFIDNPVPGWFVRTAATQAMGSGDGSGGVGGSGVGRAGLSSRVDAAPLPVVPATQITADSSVEVPEELEYVSPGNDPHTEYRVMFVKVADPHNQLNVRTTTPDSSATAATASTAPGTVVPYRLCALASEAKADTLPQFERDVVSAVKATHPNITPAICQCLRYVAPNAQPGTLPKRLLVFEAGIRFLADHMATLNIKRKQELALTLAQFGFDVAAAMEFLHARRLDTRCVTLERCVVCNDGRVQVLYVPALPSASGALPNPVGLFARLFGELLLQANASAKVRATFASLFDLLGVSDGQYGLAYGSVPATTSITAVVLELQRHCDHSWEVSWKDLTFVKVLGSGQFGEVQLMTMTSRRALTNLSQTSGSRRVATTTELVAVKTLLDEQFSAEFTDEMRLMMKIRHPNLVTILRVVTSEVPKAIVLEFLEGGSLEDWLGDAMRGKICSVEDMLYILYQVACGAAELARLGIVHRDIAARNVLIGRNTEAKLSDYGLSRAMTIGHDSNEAYYRMQTSRPLPIRWMSPEMVSTQKATMKSDVWSFGMLMFEVLSRGELPYPSLSNEAVVQALVDALALSASQAREHHVCSAPPSCPPPLSEVFYECIIVPPTERPSFEELVLRLAPYTWRDLQGIELPATSGRALVQDQSTSRL